MAERERSPSPNTRLWAGRGEAMRQQATMIEMGLHVFSPEWQGEGSFGRKYSTSMKETTMKIYGTEETMTFPVQVCTKVVDVKNALAQFLMLDDKDTLKFIVKQGCSSRTQFDHEELAKRITVRGITSFKIQAKRWPYPICIVGGAGYNGLKTGIVYMKSGNSNIVGFDRLDRVGGYCWLQAANKTSKLQTEMGSFHVWWGQEFVQDGCGYPSDWECWPMQAGILKSFQFAAEQYGLLPHIKFRHNMFAVEIIGNPNGPDCYYNLGIDDLDAKVKSWTPVSVIYSFPGGMTRNRIITYPGEEDFEGNIGYGMGNDIPFDYLAGNRAAIVGNGAFAIENIRTCCEYACEKVYLVTRRKNMPSPRIPCWFVHQGPLPVPGRMVVKMFEPMYKAGGMGDPWTYHAVHASSDRQKVTIIQNSRFGIGDVTFLAVAYGKCEYVEDTIKRMTRRTLHLVGGEKLENMTNVIKALGLLGDHEVDRIHNMKYIHGSFISGDFRRPCHIDDPGMNAANFATFSTGIGSTGFIRNMKFLHDFPKEFQKLKLLGLMDQLPMNYANAELDKPAYVSDVRFSMTSSMLLETMCPKMTQMHVADPDYKYKMYHAAHPTDKFMRECIESWDNYQVEFKKQGSTHKYIPYPYTREMIEGYFQEYSTAMGYPISSSGPPPGQKVSEANVREFVKTPHWAANEQSLEEGLRMAQETHYEYWDSQVPVEIRVWQARQKAKTLPPQLNDA